MPSPFSRNPRASARAGRLGDGVQEVLPGCRLPAPCPNAQGYPLMSRPYFAWLPVVRPASRKQAQGGRARRRSVFLQVEPLERRWLLTNVHFIQSNYPVNEAETDALITITLDSPPVGSVTADLIVGNGTAQLGTDYTYGTMTLLVTIDAASS